MNHSDPHREPELGSPRGGFVSLARAVTQAVGLGWHTAATLWRERSVARIASPMLPDKLLAEFWRLAKEAEKMLEGLAEGR